MASDQEHQEQKSVVEWWSLAYPLYRDYLYAVPNGSYLGKDETTRFITMKKLKAEGLRKGIPDLSLDIPNKHYHGLKIEMKATGRTWAHVSKDQRVKLAMFESAGFKAIPCAGVIDAINEIKDYVKDIEVWPLTCKELEEKYGVNQ